MGSSTNNVKKYKKPENKWKKDLKDLNKQNKMRYIISKKTGSRCEINIIKAKSSKSTIVSSSDYLDSDYLLGRNSSWETYRKPARNKELNKLYHLVTKNLNIYKDQSNEAINSEPTFDISSFNLSSGTSDPLPVVTVSLWVGKKHRATTVEGITCLWDSGATKL